MIRALLLDLGNVLVSHDNAKLFRTLAAALGRPQEDVERRLDASLWARVNRGQLPGDQLRRAVVATLGVEITPARWFEVWNCHFSLNTEMIAVVEQLVGRVRLVLLSNTHDQHIAFIRPQVPVLARFDGLVLSCEVGFAKPEPEIYRRALEVAGVAPAEAAFFDDVPAYAEAATRLGIAGHVFSGVDQFRVDLAALGLALEDSH